MKVYVRVMPDLARCIVARSGGETLVLVRGQHIDLEEQLTDLDILLTPAEKAAIRAAYGWTEGGLDDVRATPADYVPPQLAVDLPLRVA